MLSLASQLLSFGFIILAGGICGIVFDFYRVLRSICRPRSVVAAVFDLVFWLVLTPILFALLVVGNWGAMRFYVFIGLGVGLFAYFQVMSGFILWVMIGFAEGIRRVFCSFGGLFIGVIAVPFGAARGLGRPGGFFARRSGLGSRGLGANRWGLRPPRRFW